MKRARAIRAGPYRWTLPPKPQPPNPAWTIHLVCPIYDKQQNTVPLVTKKVLQSPPSDYGTHYIRDLSKKNFEHPPKINGCKHNNKNEQSKYRI